MGLDKGGGGGGREILFVVLTSGPSELYQKGRFLYFSISHYICNRVMYTHVEITSKLLQGCCLNIA